MKNSTLCAVALSSLLVSSTAFAEQVFYRNLPDQVRKAVRHNRDDIERIESFQHNGKTVYEVQIDKDGPDQFVYLDSNGNRINDPSLRNERLAASENLKLKNLPKAVQKTFKERVGSAEISDIDIDAEDGNTVYEIEYARRDRTGEIHINKDGSIARRDRESKRERRLSRNEKENQNAVGFDRSLSGSRKVDFEDVPKAVKKTVREVAGDNRIEDAERGTLDGKTVYQIAFKKNGNHNELRVAEDGDIVQRIAGTNFRFPGSLSENEVPAPVRRAIEEQVGSGEVNDIDKKTVDGKTVYQVGFKKESGGAQHEIQIASDGTVLGEPAGAENK